MLPTQANLIAAAWMLTPPHLGLTLVHVLSLGVFLFFLSKQGVESLDAFTVDAA
jgi:hypothetical protein